MKDLGHLLPLIMFVALVLGKAYGLVNISWLLVAFLPLTIYLFGFIVMMLYFIFIIMLAFMAGR